MKPSSRDHLGLPSPLHYAANQSGNVNSKSPSKKEAGLDVSHQALVSREGRGENFFLDILFHRMSVTAVFHKPRSGECQDSLSPRPSKSLSTPVGSDMLRLL